MSFGAYTAASIDERKAREAAKRRAAAERAERSERAQRLVAERLPDLAGDPFAIYAVLQLVKSGERLTEAAIRRKRGEYVIETDRGTTVAQRAKEGWK